MRLTVVKEWDVEPEHLADYYQADSIESAAVNQQKWLNEGGADLLYLLDDGSDLSITVVGIP